MENIGAFLGFWERGAQKRSNFEETASRSVKRWASTTVFLSFFMILFIGSFLYWVNVVSSLLREEIFASKSSEESLGECPEYFRWIHKDLEPWKHTGISREMLERAKAHAQFRLVIINGDAYVEKYKNAYQTRDVFTVWGILQLLRLYPGKVPDLELMFSCGDRPVVKKRDYEGANSTSPPPVFHYCGDQESLDIVFPDWSFWGWAETNIRPWNSILEDIKEGNKRTKWINRAPYAYWKGNPYVSIAREDLMKCNVTDKYQWKTRLYVQHYWPVRTARKCRDIKFAVEWGNTHTRQARAIGRAGSRYMQEKLKMKYVYDYMFHLLIEYAKLLKFEPRIPNEGKKVCAQKLASSQNGLGKRFMVESMVNSSSETLPCTMPPPFEPLSLEAFFENNEMIKRQVEMREKDSWESLKFG
ncbi:CAP10 domain-containing protein [Citrus sinensis]|uniref:CAP10 domain-containing protein n=1 Tax=Citrus sinensis TaxID=2711 RepID=A0ACB8MQP4_CITSI|nr:CAP10 domain-containing protein [Citrus sinensis]KAH9787927.1 CAP10 domain-containing protein [Citrus sinensis]